MLKNFLIKNLDLNNKNILLENYKPKYVPIAEYNPYEYVQTNDN